MAAYDPSPNAVLIKQFRTGSNNYYENIELSGSSVLIHTDITGSVTGSNFTLAADTGNSYSIVVYQNNAFKLTPSTTSSTSLVFRTVTFSTGSRAVVSAFGSQTDLNNASVTFTGGNTVTISSIGSLDLYQITVNYDSNINSGTAFSLVYPEVKGETSITTTQYPICAHYNQASPSVIQSNTNWNMSNSSGTVTVQKTGLTNNAAAVFKVQF